MQTATLTKGHFNFISNTLDAHESESDNSYDGYGTPTKLLDKRERKCKKV